MAPASKRRRPRTKLELALRERGQLFIARRGDVRGLWQSRKAIQGLRDDDDASTPQRQTCSSSSTSWSPSLGAPLVAPLPRRRLLERCRRRASRARPVTNAALRIRPLSSAFDLCEPLVSLKGNVWPNPGENHKPGIRIGSPYVFGSARHAYGPRIDLPAAGPVGRSSRPDERSTRDCPSSTGSGAWGRGFPKADFT